MDRRTFLSRAAAAGLALTGCRGRPAGAGAVTERLGVQLYTVRDRMRQDVQATLRAVAGIGYGEVETDGLFDLQPAEFRAVLERLDLTSPSGHVGLDEVRARPDAVLSVARTLGQDWIVVPWLDARERTLDGYRALAGDLNAFGARAADHGLRVAYHNHDFEFDHIDGDTTGFDVLLGETDPELVDIELDLYWAVRGGRDPVAIFRAHPGRFPLVHVKDMRDIGGAQEMVTVGAGDIDFAAIFAHADAAGLRHRYVEHDNPDDSLASIRQAFEHLQSPSR